MPLGPCRFRPLTSSVVALSAAAGPADAAFEPQFLPTLDVSRTVGAIHIDGNLDDAGWRSAAVADGFAEVQPGDQIEPAVHSEAWVTYDDANLYVALIARDDPSDVRVSLTDRDDIFTDDYFGIMLDTYGDQSWGYELFVNPLGIQGDLRMQSNVGEDGSFDLIWQSRGKVTDEGYQVEIAIPFSSLRFPDRPEQTWRINFWRDRQRDLRRKYAWAAQDRDNPCFLCQWGTLTGIRDVRPGRDLEAIASVIGSQAGHLMDDDNPTSAFRNEDVQGDASVSLKYGLSSTSTAELAINPDYSQVESDAGQIDVNSTFALYYPERRPFFQEGSNLYETWISAVYTRSINDPDVVGKITGQAGKTQFLYLAARDKATPMVLPLEERNEDVLLGDSYSNVVRVRRALHQESYVGALVTDRRLEGGGSGTVLSGDALFRVWRNYRIELQAAASRTDEPDDVSLTEDIDDVDEAAFGKDEHTLAFDGEEFWGRAFYASLERSANFWEFDFDYWEYSPEFRTDNGFTTRNDYRQGSAWTGLFFRPNKKWIVEWQPEIGIGRVWDHDDHFKDEWLRPTVWANSRWQSHFGTQYLISKERFGPETFPGIRVWSYWFEMRPHERIGFGFDGNRGQGIYRDFDDPELADQRVWSAFVDLKPSRRAELGINWNYEAFDSRERDEPIYTAWILRGRLTVNFTQQWFLRLVTEYNDYRERVDFEPLLTYRINPFTVFFAGSTNRLRHYDEDPDVPFGPQWKSSERQYFAKLQYLFQL